MRPSPFYRACRASALVITWALTACVAEDTSADIPSVVRLEPSGYEAAIDSVRILARQYIAAAALPGLTVALGRGGEVIYSEAFGWADLSGEREATPETMYPIGSISKSMTATAAAILYDRGMLDLDVPIQEYVDFPEKRWPFTPRQLMGHTAGVRNYGAARALRQGSCTMAGEGLDDFATDTLLFEPGTEYDYSNYGFRMVGAIVESAAGERYLDFMQREVFDAIGLEHTKPDLGTVPGSAIKYDWQSFRTLSRSLEVDMSCTMPEGGFLSTPTELIEFSYSLLNGALVQPETLELWWMPQRLASGVSTSYGMGFASTTVPLASGSGRTRMVGHGGSVLGGRSSLQIFPEEDIVVSAMTNTRSNVQSFSRDVARLFLKVSAGTN